MKKKVLALIAIIAVAFVGGYLLNEPKAEAGIYKSSRAYYYQTFEVNGKTIVIIENAGGETMTAVALD